MTEPDFTPDERRRIRAWLATLPQSRWTDGLRLGIQPGTALEQADVYSGRANTMRREQYVAAVENGATHFRIPACLSAITRSDINGRVSPGAMSALIAQVDMAQSALTAAGLAPRVVIDWNHNNLPRKKDKRWATNWDARLYKFTEEQHAARDMATALDVAKAFANYDENLAFDLFNEPAGMTHAQLNESYVATVAAIRALGGFNASRAIHLEPLGTAYRALTIPPGGNIVLQPHIYTPFTYTHQSAPLTDAGLTAYEAEVRMFRQYCDAIGVEGHIGEAGSLNTRPDRAEYTSHIRNCAEIVSTSLWSYGDGFGAYKPGTVEMLPGMADAFAGRTPVRPYKTAMVLDTRNAVILSAPEGTTLIGGVLSVPANPVPPTRAKRDYGRFISIMFPDVPFTRVGRVWPAIPTGNLLYQVQAVDPKTRKVVAIPSGYRASAGVMNESSTIPDGAVLMAYIEQPDGAGEASEAIVGYGA